MRTFLGKKPHICSAGTPYRDGCCIHMMSQLYTWLLFLPICSASTLLPVIFPLIMLLFRSFCCNRICFIYTCIPLAFRIDTAYNAYRCDTCIPDHHFIGGLLFFISLLHYSLGFSGNLKIPISIILIHYVLISVYLFFTRIAVKLLFRFATSSLKGSKRKVLIYGAGEMGFIVKRVLVSDPGEV